MTKASISCFYCEVQKEIQENETIEEAADRVGWGKTETTSKESVKVGGNVCPACLGILLDPLCVSCRRKALKAGTGGARVNIRPGRMVGLDVICLYVPPIKNGKKTESVGGKEGYA